MNKQNFFLKNSTFSQKKSLDARIAVVTTREKNFFPTKRFLDQSPKKVWKIIYISKIDFPQKLPRIHRLRVSQLWQKISLEVNIGSESEKKNEFFSFWKKVFINCSHGHILLFCQPWKVFPSLSRKLQKFFENPRVFKTSIRKICSVSVPLDTSKCFWQPCQNFSCKNLGFSFQNPKKTKNQLFNSFFWRFYLRTLSLLFQHTWLSFLPKSEKSHWKSKREDNSEKYFNHFFWKFCWGHVKWKLATCRNFLPKYGNFRSETKNDQRITLLSKRASKRSAAPVGCSFENFDKKFSAKVQ